MDNEQVLQKEIRRLRNELRNAERRLEDGRHYLMGVEPENLTVADTLEAFGWTRNGLNEVTP